MRNDPGENGGLFMGRRPGTAPVRYRTLPQRGTPVRQRIDGLLAGVALSAIVLLGILCWGPIPLLCLWICAQINYLTSSVSLGIASAFVMLIALLFGALQTMHDIDRMWIVLRRAAGHDQRSGALERIFAITAVLGVTLFVFWFLAIHGVGSTDYSGTQVLHAGFPQFTSFTIPRLH